MAPLRKYRFMLMRRSSQAAVISLFAAGNTLGSQVMRGNLSSSKILDTVPLTDPFAVLQISAAGRIVSAEALLGAFIAVVFFGLVAGRAFCSWVCPMNIVTDLANWLRAKIRLDAGGTAAGVGRTARYWIMFISLVVSAVTGVAAFEWISPVSALHRGVIFGMGAGWTAVLAVFLFDLVLVKHGFCGHLCPLGVIYSVISRYSLIRVRHSREKCTLCMKCLEICPERQVLPMVGKESALVTSGECSNCARCIEVCDDKAMRLGVRFVP